MFQDSQIDDLIQNLKMKKALGLKTEIDPAQIKQIKENDQHCYRYMDNVKEKANLSLNNYFKFLNIAMQIYMIQIIISNLVF